MALQDLTPQLRTRLSRVERAVGWFVFLATALLIFGFGYYIYKTAQRKGWFTPKFKYQTSLNNAAGIKEGDPVRLMGKNVGVITEIIPNDPKAYYGITINFTVLKPNYGYIWDDSKVKVTSDFLGNRFLEITKGVAGVPTISETTNKVPIAMLSSEGIRAVRQQVLADIRKLGPDMEQTNRALFDWNLRDELERRVKAGGDKFYTNLLATYWIEPAESPALTERLENVADQIEKLLPTVTTKLIVILGNTEQLTSNLTETAISARSTIVSAQSVVTNLNGMIADARLVVTNFGGVSATVNDELPALIESIGQSLDSLATLTSNLNAQVQMNTNILGTISTTVSDTDDFVQGLKRHWLLRSAFKTKPAPPPAKKK